MQHTASSRVDVAIVNMRLPIGACHTLGAWFDRLTMSGTRLRDSSASLGMTILHATPPLRAPTRDAPTPGQGCEIPAFARMTARAGNDGRRDATMRRLRGGESVGQVGQADGDRDRCEPGHRVSMTVYF